MEPKINWDIHFFKLQIQTFSFWSRQCSHSIVNTMNHDQSSTEPSQFGSKRSFDQPLPLQTPNEKSFTFPPSP